jgi:acyl carrier protein phosphodiesterase
MFGNFIGDLISVVDIPLLEDEIQNGIQLHRRIDVLTDRHASNLKVVQIFQPRHGPYSPVIADIAYDYFLWKHWCEFSDEKIDDYLAWVYHHLRLYYAQYREILPNFVEDMLRNEWLGVYSNFFDLNRVYQSMKKRVSQPKFFDSCTETIAIHEDEIDAHFLNLFRHLVKMSTSLRNEMKG